MGGLVFADDVKMLYLILSGMQLMYNICALAKMVSHWSTNMNKGDLARLILLDLHKAFDMEIMIYC